VTLYEDCDQLVVAADGVTVNLNGHTVSGIRLLDRSNVTIRNGSVTLSDDGRIEIQGGGNNVLRELAVDSENTDPRAFEIRNSTNNRLLHISMNANMGGSGLTIGGRGNLLSDSRFIRDEEGEGALLSIGSFNSARRNVVISKHSGNAVALGGSTLFEDNAILFQPSEFSSPSNSAPVALNIYGMNAIARDNFISVSRSGSEGSFEDDALTSIRVRGARNTLERNSIWITPADNNGFGASTGTEGISLGFGARRNLVRRNWIAESSTSNPEDASSITIAGAFNRVSDNSVEHIYVSGRSNLLERNLSGFMTDTNRNCDNNAWINNIFTADSEGNGPNKGCIR
jgi:hypothetical protein